MFTHLFYRQVFEQKNKNLTWDLYFFLIWCQISHAFEQKDNNLIRDWRGLNKVLKKSMNFFFIVIKLIKVFEFFKHLLNFHFTSSLIKLEPTDQILLNRFFDSIIPFIRTSKIHNCRQGAPKWQMASGRGSTSWFLDAPINFRQIGFLIRTAIPRETLTTEKNKQELA